MAKNIDFGTSYKRFVRYFWDPEPKNDDPDHSPIWCLGEKYNSEKRPTSSSRSQMQPKPPTSPSLPATETADNETVILPNDIPSSERKSDTNGIPAVDVSTTEEDRGWPAEFLDDFESTFWFTYRSHFPPIAKSVEPAATGALTLAVRLRSQLGATDGFTNDTGWGCMIRSGQCVVGNAIGRLKLGRDWRRGTKQTEEKEILSWFADDPAAPFSIHKFVSHGASACGKHPGEWFGPSAAARCIQALSHAHHDSGLKVYLTGDGPDVYEESVLKLAREDDPTGKTFTPVLILAGTRLGIDRVNPVYWESLKKCLQLPQSIGIAGGRPSASHYFIGTQSSQIFYLDPHQTRPALSYHADVSTYNSEEISSCHTRRLRRLDINQMDPSMLIAFLITSEDDFHAWKQSMQEVQGKCVIHVSLHEPNVKGLEEMVLTEDDDEDGEHDIVDREDEEHEDEVENEGELIESRRERREAVDEVEALPDDPDETTHIKPLPATTHSTSAAGVGAGGATSRRSELTDDDDGEIVNIPTPSPRR